MVAVSLETLADSAANPIVMAEVICPYSSFSFDYYSSCFLVSFHVVVDFVLYLHSTLVPDILHCCSPCYSVSFVQGRSWTLNDASFSETKTSLRCRYFPTIDSRHSLEVVFGGEDCFHSFVCNPLNYVTEISSRISSLHACVNIARTA